MRSKLLLSVLCGSSSLFAMSPVLADCCPNNPAMWEIGVTGYWIKPSANFTQYGYSSAGPTIGFPPGTPSGILLKNEPKFKFRYGVNVGYRFCESLTNINATYIWGTNNTSNSASGTIAVTSLPAEDGINFARGAASEYKYRFRFGNIELGAFYCLCKELSINPLIGLSYFNTRNDQYIAYTDTGGTVGARATIDFRSRFTGYGPSVGVNFGYPLCWGFSFVSNNRFSALIGKNTTNVVHFNRSAAGADSTGSFNIVTDSRRTVVNLLQNELGLAYGFDWACDFTGKVVAGYQIKTAFNAVERFNFPSSTNVTFVDFTKYNSSDQGPFLRLAVTF